MAKRNYAEITPEIHHYAELCGRNVIDRELYEKFRVNRGLRDMAGKGVDVGPSAEAVHFGAAGPELLGAAVSGSSRRKPIPANNQLLSLVCRCK